MKFKNWLINEASETLDNSVVYESERKLREIANRYPETHHHLRITCENCGNVSTCRCTAPKVEYKVASCMGCDGTLKAIKLPDEDSISPGVRKMSDDLKDYKGHLKRNGTVEPWKILKPSNKNIG